MSALFKGWALLPSWWMLSWNAGLTSLPYRKCDEWMRRMQRLVSCDIYNKCQTDKNGFGCDFVVNKRLRHLVSAMKWSKSTPKNNIARGQDGLPDELLKTGGYELISRLHQLIYKSMQVYPTIKNTLSSVLNWKSKTPRYARTTELSEFSLSHIRFLYAEYGQMTSHLTAICDV